MTSKEALAFVKFHGVVLESGRAQVPNLAEAIAGAFGLPCCAWQGISPRIN